MVIMPYIDDGIVSLARASDGAAAAELIKSDICNAELSGR
jgi:hypothetical protein